jgi:peptide/nickel transport system substrate-binding protein
VRRLAAILAAALLLAAAPARAGVRPAYGGTVRVLLPAAPRVLDPARALEPADLFAVRALHAPLLEVDAAGRLAPGLLAEVPAPEAGARAFRLRLAPGLRFSDGSPVTAASVAVSLSRLLARDPASPHAWVALPILGADALLDGRAATLAGVQVLSDRELLVTLAFPFPDFPWALAALPAAVVSPRGAGAGPFVLETQDAAGLRLAPNPNHARGRPFAGALVLGAADARSSARALSAGATELVVRPERGGASAVDGPALTVVASAVNFRRLGAGAAPLADALRAVDRAELARLFVRAPATPMDGLVPPALLAAAAASPVPTGAAAGAPPPRVGLLVPAGAPDLRAAADRIQVRLFDRGVRVAVEEEPAARFAARVAAGDYDVAIAAVPVLALRPALAAGEVALALRGPAVARQVMAALAALPPEDAAARAAALARELDVVPLFATGQRATATPALQGARFRADGAIDAGDLWLLGGAP